MTTTCRGYAKNTHKTEIEAIRQLVTTLRGDIWILPQSQRLRGSAGLPDLLVVFYRDTSLCQKPFGFFVEVKVGADRMSEAQMDFQWAMECVGLEVILGDVGKVIEVLKRHGIDVESKRRR